MSPWTKFLKVVLTQYRRFKRFYITECCYLQYDNGIVTWGYEDHLLD